MRLAHTPAGRAALAVGTVVAFLVGSPSASFAAVDPGTVTAVTGGFTDLQDMLTTSLIPALFALLLIGIAVKVGSKYLSKGASKS